MKTSGVMKVTVKGQAQLPKGWRERAGLSQGGAVRVVEVDNGEHSLLLTPIPAPEEGARGLAAMLKECPGEIPLPERHRLPFR